LGVGHLTGKGERRSRSPTYTDLVRGSFQCDKGFHEGMDCVVRIVTRNRN
jgi:hypothetical protein